MEYVSLEQEVAVESPAKYKLINGCAGSRKTDTLVKCAIRHLHGPEPSPILFLTLVSSVTDELRQRLESTLQISIEKQGISNHYVGRYGPHHTPIVIANFDAWVHLMCTQLAIPIEDASAHDLKKEELLRRIRELPSCICFTRATGHYAGLLLLDEFQDFSPTAAKIVVELSKRNGCLKTIAAGDYLQTIFEHDEADEAGAHAMNIFKEVEPAFFQLSTCFRCPKGHIAFNNMLMQKAQKKYALEPMACNNDMSADKPVLFCHPAISKNADARITAEIVYRQIQVLMSHDTTIVPADIAIIMARSNENAVFIQLKILLEKFYGRIGFPGAVHIFETRVDGGHKTIRWEDAVGKTVMISIHGDKGRGHKVVFFLGFTELSIPKDANLFKPREIVCESLANVATTRSTKYLLIGFNDTFPSRYLHNIYNNIEELCYCSWSSRETVPDIYRELLDVSLDLHNAEPVWQEVEKKYRQKQLNTSSANKNRLFVTESISRDFERPSCLVKHPWKRDMRCDPFGTSSRLITPFRDDHFIIFGEMAELMILRNRGIFHGDKTLLKYLDGAVFTKDERTLNFVYDYQINSATSFGDMIARVSECKRDYEKYFVRNPEFLKAFDSCFTSYRKVLHNVFSSVKFYRELELFLSGDRPNSEIPSEVFWNVTLFFNHIDGGGGSGLYRPAIFTYMDYFKENIEVLHENIRIFNQRLTDTLKSEHSMIVQAHITNRDKLIDLGVVDIDKKDNPQGYVFSIHGRLDIYDAGTETLYEIKASVRDEPSKEWLTQAIMYCLMLGRERIIPKRICIVNILKGESYVWDSLPVMSLKHVIESAIKNKYKIHPHIIESLLEDCRAA